MSPTLWDLLRMSITLLAMINPIGALPFFLHITEGTTLAHRRRMALVASTTVVTLLLVASYCGLGVIRLFGIGLPAFQVGGGIIVLLIAISMVQAETSRAKMTNAEEAEAAESGGIHAAVIPTGIPLLVGPGVITTTILFTNQHWSAAVLGGMTVSAIVIGLVTYVTLRLSVPLGRWLGRSGMNIVTRLMGLMLAGISVEIMSRGLLQLFPGLGGPVAP